jgi:archaellum component FlaF (FlaF/FlaG flagellin family)
MKRAVALHLCSLVAASYGSLASAQVTTLASVDSSGGQGNGISGATAITPDARYVVFDSDATNLVPGDTNTWGDVFVRDRYAGTTERISVDSSGTQGSNFSWSGSISADGRYVSFLSAAPDLVPGDTNGMPDVFVRDRQLGLTTRVSVASSGSEGNAPCWSHAISADGRYVAFESRSTNLIPGATSASKFSSTTASRGRPSSRASTPREWRATARATTRPCPATAASSRSRATPRTSSPGTRTR